MEFYLEVTTVLTHIFLSLELMEAGKLGKDDRTYLAIIRQNTERPAKLVQYVPENFTIPQLTG